MGSDDVPLVFSKGRSQVTSQTAKKIFLGQRFLLCRATQDIAIFFSIENLHFDIEADMKQAEGEDMKQGSAAGLKQG